MTLPEQNEDGTYTCPKCDRRLKRQGFYPHVATHKPKQAVKPDPVEMPPLYETLSGVLYGYAGDTIPTSMLAEVSEWMAQTEHLIAALARK